MYRLFGWLWALRAYLTLFPRPLWVLRPCDPCNSAVIGQCDGLKIVRQPLDSVLAQLFGNRARVGITYSWSQDCKKYNRLDQVNSANLLFEFSSLFSCSNLLQKTKTAIIVANIQLLWKLFILQTMLNHRRTSTSMFIGHFALTPEPLVCLS